MTDRKADKRRLRGEMASQRRCVDPAHALEAGRAVARYLLAELSVQTAARVALYAALPDELPSRPLFEGLVKAGVQVLLPRIAGDRALVFCSVEHWSDLRVSGRLRILEPPEGSPRVRPVQGDVVMVPGVAFDADGWRLGRGAGYYDRAFPPEADAPPLLFGLAYAFQVVPSLPHGSHDRRMDAIVTERGVVRVQGAGS